MAINFHMLHPLSSSHPILSLSLPLSLKLRSQILFSPLFTACQNLKKLYLRNLRITDLFLQSNISRFSHLEVLKFVGCNMLERLKISAHWLQRLYQWLDTHVVVSTGSFISKSELVSKVLHMPMLGVDSHAEPIIKMMYRVGRCL